MSDPASDDTKNDAEAGHVPTTAKEFLDALYDAPDDTASELAEHVDNTFAMMDLEVVTGLKALAMVLAACLHQDFCPSCREEALQGITSYIRQAWQRADEAGFETREGDFVTGEPEEGEELTAFLDRVLSKTLAKTPDRAEREAEFNALSDLEKRAKANSAIASLRKAGASAAQDLISQGVKPEQVKVMLAPIGNVPQYIQDAVKAAFPDGLLFDGAADAQTRH